MSDLISRQAAIEIIHSLYPSEPIMPRNREWWGEQYKPFIEAEKALEMLPSAQPTLYGYNIEHLELIARVLQKEDLPPEKVAEVLNDIGRIVAIVKDEFEETLRKAVEQCTI